MDNICFIDHHFIVNNPLTPDNIIDYFATSPFYDKSSTNEVLKMQNQYRGISTIQEDISKYKGMYYKLDYSAADNSLFVIRQAIKDKGDVAFYYVIHGHIYQAPSDRKIFNSRINDIYWYLNEILDYYFYKMNSVGEDLQGDGNNTNLPDDVLREVSLRFEKKFN